MSPPAYLNVRVNVLMGGIVISAAAFEVNGAIVRRHGQLQGANGQFAAEQK